LDIWQPATGNWQLATKTAGKLYFACRPLKFGAGNRTRTGDIYLGKVDIT
jgi:hypothetical protein